MAKCVTKRGYRAICASMAFLATVSAACNAYALTDGEPPDFRSNLNTPDYIGMLDPGLNTITGSINAECISGGGRLQLNNFG